MQRLHDFLLVYAYPANLIVDLTACWSYCSYKNYKEISKKLAVQTAEGKEQLEKKNQQNGRWSTSCELGESDDALIGHYFRNLR